MGRGLKPIEIKEDSEMFELDNDYRRTKGGNFRA